ncbi:MAG TPA: NADH:flavin oxidoreductase/NADH oxidase [Pseudacidobacterium sp.]|jgi:2,4-dienoyl-CoA reductase-like NADH-dependent reductase (Old Yellow Enzyme family)|nr:NADH:flavin oxidoreductase/NADH oxidase [Pseudacidobacterium sp.]
MPSENSSLFAPFPLRNVALPNRVVVSPMCQYSSEDGFANDWHLVHLGSRAIGGPALVMTEATAVTPEGRISPGDLGIWKDEHIAPLKRIVDFLHQHGVFAGIQLAHAGRKASMAVPWEGEHVVTPDKGGWQDQVFAPSAIPFSSHYAHPRELDASGIQRISVAFARAAKRAKLAGFDVVEIHSAHGYLLHEFLSPLSNQRSDKYGGSFENRIRLLTEIVHEVREEWTHDRPLFIRISATDWADGGWNLQESIRLSTDLRRRNVDLIDVSSGGLVPGVKIPVGPGYQTHFAEQIRRQSGIATGTVGMITEPAQADHILRTGQADLVFMAREFLRDPYWALHAADDLGQKISWPAQYLRAATAGVPSREPISADEAESLRIS